MKRLVVGIGGVLALLCASPALASAPIGQLPPAGFTPNNCGPTSGSYAQPTITSGRGYVVPANGTRISSWSTHALATTGQELTMTVFRPLGGDQFLAVTHDGPRPLTPSAVNTFAVDLAVMPGDVLGLVPGIATNFPVACGFAVSGETDWVTGPVTPPPDGQSATFQPNSGVRLNVAAQVEVSNIFTFAVSGRNKRRGTVTVTATGTGPGKFVVWGKRFKPQEATLGNAPGTATLTAVPAGKLKRTLKKRGKARTTVSVTFTPDGGDPNVQSQPVKLIKKR